MGYIKRLLGAIFCENKNIETIMERTITKPTMILVVLLYFTQFLNGQIKIDNFTVSPKIGLGHAGIYGGGNNYGLELNTRSKGLIYSVYYHKFQGVDVLFNNIEPNEHNQQLGFMVGRYFGERTFRLHLQGGVSGIWGLARTELLQTTSGFLGSTFYYGHENFFTCGIALKVGFKLNSQSVGCGFDILTNVNIKSSRVLMVMFTLQFGKLRIANWQKKDVVE